MLFLLNTFKSQTSAKVLNSSVHETHGLVHNCSKAFSLTVLPTSNGRKLRQLDAKVFRLLYGWREVPTLCELILVHI